MLPWIPGQFDSDRIEEWTSNTSLAIGVSNVQVSTKKVRQAFLIRNTSTDASMIITLFLGRGAASNNNGIVLRQNEIYGEDSSNGFRAFGGDIQAICAAANGQISIFER